MAMTRRRHEYKSGGARELACPSLGQNSYWYNIMIYKALVSVAILDDVLLR